jgi:ethanolamine ammonia-lyase small subunit
MSTPSHDPKTLRDLGDSAELSEAAGADRTAEAVTGDVWARWQTQTPARIGLGRSGVSLPTQEWLKFGVAHAQARDAVQLPLDVPALLRDLQAVLAEHTGPGLPQEILQVHSAVPDRARYLLRPDGGRRLSADSAQTLSTRAAGQAATDVCDLLIVIGDGLSAAAVSAQAVPLLRELLAQRPPGWTLGPVVVASQARVALGDDIGERLRARQVAMLIGERPGLSSPDSLGIYLTHSPRVGCHDAQRNCISNVRAAGLPHAEAARKLWWLAQAARRLGLTGVGLKDHSDERALPASTGVD